MKGTVRKRGDSWYIIYDAEREGNGRRRQKWKRVVGTKRDAERELHRVLHEQETGALAEPTRLTVAMYLGQWLTDYAKPNVSAKTFQRYEEIVRRHLIPAVGHHVLAKLQPLHIQSYYSSAQQCGRLDGKGGLSARTLIQHHRILREALHHAVGWQLLLRNPADSVQPPAARHVEMKSLDLRQALELCENAKDTMLELPVMLAVTTGMRRGEILALRWSDVDLERSRLNVTRSLEVTKAGLQFKQPKTAKGRRLIALLPMCVDALRAQAEAQKEHRRLLGDGYQNGDLVVAHADGSPVHPDRLSKSWEWWRQKWGLGSLRFHDLRHSHATHLFMQGEHPKIVSERLGHSSIGITLDTYSHVMPGMQEEAAARLEAGFRKAER